MSVLNIRLLAVATIAAILASAAAVSAESLPAGWSTRDVGAVGRAGSVAVSGDTMTVRGSGSDVWGSADEFRFVYTTMTGDGSIVTRVSSIENVNAWVKAGVMMRETLAAGSPHAFMLVSPGKGLAFQRRTAASGTSVHTSGGSGSSPAFVKLTRVGNAFTAQKSADGVSWTTVGSQTIAMGATIHVGLAVSSHVDGTLAAATFTQTDVTLPGGWASRDIGAVGATGTATALDGVLTVRGSGADVWGTADEFRYVYQPLTGDGSIVTQVTAIENVNAWVKAGVMMRESLAANARHAFMLVSPGKGLAFQRRNGAGGESVHTSGGSGTSPAYVKLTRVGSTITASRSTDGTAWTTVGTQSLSMGATIYVGVAVSSHVDGKLAQATFRNTTVSAGAVASTVPPQEQAPAPAPAPAPTPEPEPEAEPAPTTQKTLRVLHWNLHHGNDPNNKWAFPRQLEVIGNANADIISLNEVEKFNSSYGNIDQAAEVAKYLTARTGTQWYQYMRVGTGSSKGIGNAIISRFPIVSTSYCQLSSNRNAVNTGVVVNGRTVNVWSTHLAVESGTYRVAEAKALVACMSNFTQQRLVAGDFNAGTGTTEIKLMVSGHLDAWATAKAMDTEINYSGNCDGCTRNSRIDYLFTSKEATAMVLKSAQMIDTRNASGTMASDHKPMLVSFDVK